MLMFDDVKLFEKNGMRFMFNINNSESYTISKVAYNVIRSLQQGDKKSELVKLYGEDNVNNVLDSFGTLERGQTSGHTREEIEKSLEDFRLSENNNYVEVMLMIAQDCNLRCDYCYGGESGRFNNRGKMSIKTAEVAFDYALKTTSDKKLLKFLFFGGEPLLNFDVIKHLVEKWEKEQKQHGREVYFTMTTNATLITEEIAEFFNRHNIQITISIDGPKEIHDKFRVGLNGSGSFDKVMAGIKILRKHDVTFGVRTTITGAESDDLNNITNFFNENKFYMNYVVPVNYPVLDKQNPYDLTPDDLLKISHWQNDLLLKACSEIEDTETDSFEAKQLSITYSNIKKRESPHYFRCGAGNWLITVDIDGNFYPCQRFVGMKSFMLGNVFDGQDKDKTVEMYSAFIEASQNCLSCWSRNLCRKRCFHMKAGCDGGFSDLPTEICDIYRDNYESAIAFVKLAKQKNQAFFDKNQNLLHRYDTEKMVDDYRKELENKQVAEESTS